MKFNEKINSLLNEYVNSDMSMLAKYIGATEEDRVDSLPRMFPYLLNDFLEYLDVDKSELDIPDFDDLEDYEVVERIEEANSDFYLKFGKWIYDKVMDGSSLISQTDLPSWAFFSEPKLIKNQWLLHFTNDSDSIFNNGFKYGVDDMQCLGLTTCFTNDAKKYGGYNFAYSLSDKYKMDSGKYIYGDEAVLFRASGYRFWHNGDEEYQVIFRGDTATNTIPIVKNSEDEWYARNRITQDEIFKNVDIDVVVKWIINNYEQYRKVLHN